MADNERNRKTLVTVIVGLLFFVLGFGCFSVTYSNRNKENIIDLKINQLYSSDYELSSLDNKFFIGSYEPSKIDVIIDSEGNEIYKNTNGIYYDGIHKLKDERYLIYDNNEGNLTTYLFDGITIENFYEIKDVNYVKPIIYTSIDKEYIVGFASMIDNNLYLYDLNSSGIIVVPGVSLVADNSTDNAYYIYNENYLVVKNTKELMGVITLDGNVVIDYKYKDIINDSNDTFIALNKNNKYGIIDKNNKVIVKFNYKVIDKFDTYYVFVDQSNKMALYDNNYKRITKYQMDYNTLIDYSIRNVHNSINLYKVNGKIAIVNNYLEDINGTEYDKHKVYIIDGNKIVKSITQIGFGYDNVIYTYDKKYNVSIYNTDLSLLFKVKLENVAKIEEISSVNNDTIKIKYLDKEEKTYTLYYDLEGNEKEFKLGNLVIKDVEYRGYIKSKKGIKTLTLYDLEDNMLASVYGNNISINDRYLIVDNSIYRIEIKETS